MYQLLVCSILWHLASGHTLFFKPHNAPEKDISLPKEDVIRAMPNVPATSATEGDVLCPGGEYACPDGYTCCRESGDKYGCCPMEQAVCCADRQHCCPHGYQCDAAHVTCVKVAAQPPPEAAQPPLEAKDITCPDKVSTCPAATTCCLMQSGWYGCCPYKQAICCADKLHCCPLGKTCDNKRGLCTDGLKTLPWGTKTPAKSLASLSTATEGTSLKFEAAGDVVCPDRRSVCPRDTTCCLMIDGNYGCCPYPAAVCCKDKLHCCPSGQQCDAAAGTCHAAGLNTEPARIEAANKMATTTALGEAADMVCPDKKKKCADDNTCCLLMTGQYGCCPYPKAVCCSDKLHCCPNGATCNEATSQCDNHDGPSLDYVSLRMNAMTSSAVTLQMTYVAARDTLCPDHKSKCPHDQTCCMMLYGRWGCCPYPAAMCCADKLHCCPRDQTCNNTSGMCDAHGGLSVQQHRLTSRTSTVASSDVMTPDTSRDTVCPDHASMCPHDDTCCIMPNGRYGCCPYPAAVCCRDKLHCCPHGMTCATATGQCLRGDGLSQPWGLKRPAVQAASSDVMTSPNTMCPDHASMCPHDETCCIMPNGRYGCCPFPAAVCCPDKLHCCPNMMTCVTATGQCVKENGISLEMALQLPAMPVGPLSEVSEISWKEVSGTAEWRVCPDKLTICANSFTCCEISDNRYACCPIKDALCCEDRIHCCPQDATCDVERGACVFSDGRSQAWTHLGEGTTVAALAGDVVCPDKRSMCPMGNTCCLLPGGEYGCCPYPKAVCCSDHIHCCPTATTCNPSQGTCDPAPLGTHTTPLGEVKGHATSLSLAEQLLGSSGQIVVCPDKRTACPDGSTCCPLASGFYGCCNVSHAVCCSDHVHCCPEGYTCEVSTGVCTRGAASTPWSVKQPALALPPPVLDVAPTPHGYVLTSPEHDDVSKAVTKMCPGGRSSCPEGTTCCPLGSGRYGCCPYVQATCCSDHTHCCPHGYTCDILRQQCMNGDLRLTWADKMPAAAELSPSDETGGDA